MVVSNPRQLSEKRNDLHTEQRDPGENIKLGTKDPKRAEAAEKRAAQFTKPNGPRNGPNGPAGPGATPGVPGGGPGGPGAGGPGGGGPGGGFNPSPEQRARMERELNEFKDQMRKAKTPEERKKLFDQRVKDTEQRMAERIPDEAQRQQIMTGVVQRLREQLSRDGIEVPE
jgi:hypothetical protein